MESVMFRDWFDERFTMAAARSFLFSPVRVAVALVLWALVGLSVSWTVASIWLAAAMAIEWPFRAITKPAWKGETLSRGDCWRLFFTYLVAVAVWSAAGAVLWASPDPACEIAGAAFFAGHLLYVETHHGRSLGAMLPTLPALAAPVAAPFVVPHFHGVDQLLVEIVLVVVVGHAVISIAVSYLEAEQLMRTKAEMLTARDEAELASRAKSAFLATMSHEIRTPLNGVLGMAQAIAAERRLPGRVREQVAVIRQSGEGLLAILNDILDLSRVEAGKLVLEAIAFDLGAVASAARETFAPLADEKAVALELALEAGAHGRYEGDPTRVRQILHNLISNALKFTEAGGRIEIGIAREADGVRITVADTGIGIAPEKLARLFQKFEQADASTTRRYGGAGLGLSICRELAELMGGAIGAESTPGEGTRFTVRLPLKWLGEAGEPAVGPKAPAPVELGGRPLRVLAAEDNAVNQLVLRTLLAPAGIEPVMVGDGRACVEAWAAGSWDLILMDVQMPVMDGPAAARAIRAAEAAQGRARTPIIALTANAMSHQVAEYAQAGMDGHVAKPVEAAALLAAIAEALEPDAGAAAADAA